LFGGILTAGAISAVFAWRQLQVRFVFGAAGFARVRPSSAEVYRWDEIERVSYEWTVVCRDGRFVRLRARFDDNEEVRRLLYERWIGPRIRECLSGLARGQEYDFSPFTVTAKELRKGDRRLPWPEFDHFEVLVNHGMMRVLRKGGLLPWALLSVKKVKNYHVLVGLLSEWLKDSDRRG
jgi:hypothetical protein